MYLFGLKLAMVRAKSRNLDQTRILDLGIYIIISALVGAKLLLLVTDFRLVHRNSGANGRALRDRAACFTGADPRRQRGAVGHPAHWPPALDRSCAEFAPGIALGHVIGRLGCLFAGCCYGKPTSVSWAITFTDPFAATNVGTPLNVALHPHRCTRRVQKP